MGADGYSKGASNYVKTNYEFEVDAGQPFSTYALQIKVDNKPSTGVVNNQALGWVKVSHAGSTQPITQDIDLSAAPLTSTKVTGTFSLPKKSGSVVGNSSIPTWWILRKGRPASFGICTKTTKKGAGELSFEGQYIKPADTSEIVTVYNARVGTGLHGSYMIVDGFPATPPALDKTLTKTSSTGAALFANLPVGDYELTASKAGNTCAVTHGWPATTAETSRLKIYAGEQTLVLFFCK